MVVGIKQGGLSIWQNAIFLAFFVFVAHFPVLLLLFVFSITLFHPLVHFQDCQKIEMDPANPQFFAIFPVSSLMMEQ